MKRKAVVFLILTALITSTAILMVSCNQNAYTAIEIEGEREFYIGEKGLDGFTVVLTKKNGTKERSVLNESMISAEDKAKFSLEGTHVITVKYKGLSKGFEIKVKKPEYDMSGVKFEDKTVVYDANPHSIMISGELPQGVKAVYEGNGKVNAGTYEVVVKFESSAPEYQQIPSKKATLTIQKANYDMSGVKFEDKTVVYSTGVNELSVEGELPEGLSVEYENNGKKDVGEYRITAKFSGDYANYNEVADMTATLKIERAKVEVIFDGEVFLTYNGKEQKTLTASTNAGLPIELEYDGNITDVGRYTVRATTTDANYQLIGDTTAVYIDYASSEGIKYALDDSGKNYKVIGYDGTESTVRIGNSYRGLPTTEIAREAFKGKTGIEEISLPATIKTIGIGAFSGCTGLKRIDLPYLAESIQSMAFANCRSLTKVNIPERVSVLGEGVFAYCVSLSELSVSEENEDYYSEGNCIISKPNGYIVSASNNSIIPTDGSIKGITQGAFMGCDALTDLVIPEGVEEIGYGAFSACNGLKSIIIPDSVKTLGQFAFSECGALESIAIPDSVTKIGEFAFYRCAKLQSVKLPENLEEIENSVFAGCTGLTSVSIPDSVTAIGNASFYDCSAIESVSIGKNVTSIDSYAFSGLTMLKEIIIPDGVRTIGENAYSDCYSARALKIGKGVESIGENAFSGCSGLVAIEADSHNEAYKSINNCLVNIQTGTVQTAGENFTLPEDPRVTEIGATAFAGRLDITEITIPANITKIQAGAFYNCLNLDRVNFADPTDWQAEDIHTQEVVVFVDGELQDPQRAGEYLAGSYEGYCWTKTVQ